MSELTTMSEHADDPDTERRALEARARSLAQPRHQHEREGLALAVFERQGVRYAIEPRYIFEVARAPRPTRLPNSPPHWLGVTSLHGELLAVAELPVLVGAGGTPASPAEGELTLLLVLGTEAREFALAIDGVHESSAAPGELLRPSHTEAAALIEGVAEDGLRVVRGDVLLADPRLFVEGHSSKDA